MNDEKPPEASGSATGAAICGAVGKSHGLAGRQQASRGGKNRAANQTREVAARRDEVLRLARQIKGINPAITQDRLASRIEEQMAAGVNLGRHRILQIMRASKR
jgi:hypothetical protein